MDENLYLEIQNQKIYYNLDRGKRKNLYIVVKQFGQVEIRAPKKMKEQEIYKFIESKKDWILKKVNEQKSKNVCEYKNGKKLKVLGKDYILEVKYNSISKAKLELYDDKIITEIPIEIKNSGNEEEVIKTIYNKLIKKIAEEKVKLSMAKICKMVGIYPEELKIRNFKTAWGNCSSKKVISINKDVCKFSEKAVNYVCLHEVCHLKYMNHSKDFWNMVKLYMPDYKDAENELKMG